MYNILTVNFYKTKNSIKENIWQENSVTESYCNRVVSNHYEKSIECWYAVEGEITQEIRDKVYKEVYKNIKFEISELNKLLNSNRNTKKFLREDKLKNIT